MRFIPGKHFKLFYSFIYSLESFVVDVRFEPKQVYTFYETLTRVVIYVIGSFSLSARSFQAHIVGLKYCLREKSNFTLPRSIALSTHPIIQVRYRFGRTRSRHSGIGISYSERSHAVFIGLIAKRDHSRQRSAEQNTACTGINLRCLNYLWYLRQK